MNSPARKDELLEVPIRASLWKTVLLAGADRRVTIIIMGSCMVLVLLSRFALWPCVTAVILSLAGQIIGVRMASVDPALIDVYLRHVGYARAYLARPDILAKSRRPHPSVPKE